MHTTSRGAIYLPTIAHADDIQKFLFVFQCHSDSYLVTYTSFIVLLVGLDNIDICACSC